MARTTEIQKALFARGRFVRLAVFAAVFLLVGCGAASPFVYDPAAYDREHPDFAKSPEDQDSVIVGYSKYGTDLSEVARLAAQRCGQFGLGIEFRRSFYRFCPLLTPIGAEFGCTGRAVDIPVVRPGDTRQSAAPRAATSSPGQPGAPLAGFAEGGRPMGVLFGRRGVTSSSETPPAPPPEAPLSPAGQ